MNDRAAQVWCVQCHDRGKAIAPIDALGTEAKSCSAVVELLVGCRLNPGRSRL